MDRNAEASTSAATPAAASDGAPTNAFGAEDFIAFDFSDPAFDQHAGSGHSAETASQRLPTDNRASRRAKARDSAQDDAVERPSTSAAATQSAGKKRKIDDREDDGKTRQERIRERKETRSLHTPWSADVDWQRCRNGAEMLHREIMAFDSWLAPTYAEHETRVMVIDLIARAIKGRWSDAQVYSFGSQETKLYLPQGDVDLVVVSDMMEYQKREKVLRSMAATLRQHNLATEVQVIARAKVPIVKFVCTYAKLRVDISVNQTNGLAAANYVNSWLKRCPSMRPLVMAVKHLLVQRGMSEVFSGGLGSYSVIIMVISFLQLHPKVQRAEIDPARNLGVLFLEFLELYGKNFGYDNCGISIRGKGGYFGKARRGWKDERKPFMLCIEDPHDPTNDISRGSYGILNIRAVFSGAFDIVTAAICQKGSGAVEKVSKRPKHRKFGTDSDNDADEDAVARSLLLEEARGAAHFGDRDPNSLLGTIVGVSKSMMKQRREMEELYHSGSLQNRLGRPPPLSSPPPAERYLRDEVPMPPPNASRGPKSKAEREAERQQRRSSPNKVKGQAQQLPTSGGTRCDPISLSSTPDRDSGSKAKVLSILGAAGRQQLPAERSSSPELVDHVDFVESRSKSDGHQNRGEALMGVSQDASTTHLHPNGVIEILSDSENEDSRYNASRRKRQKISYSNSPHPATQGRARDSSSGKRSEAAGAGDLDDLSLSAPSTFVSDSSDDAASTSVTHARDRKQRGKKGKDTSAPTLSTNGPHSADGLTTAPGVRRSRRLSNQDPESLGSHKQTLRAQAAAASSLAAVQENGPEPTEPRTRGGSKLTSRERRDFWAAKGAVSPKERESDGREETDGSGVRAVME